MRLRLGLDGCALSVDLIHAGVRFVSSSPRAVFWRPTPGPGDPCPWLHARPLWLVPGLRGVGLAAFIGSGLQSLLAGLQVPEVQRRLVAFGPEQLGAYARLANSCSSMRPRRSGHRERSALPTGGLGPGLLTRPPPPPRRARYQARRFPAWPRRGASAPRRDAWLRFPGTCRESPGGSPRRSYPRAAWPAAARRPGAWWPVPPAPVLAGPGHWRCPRAAAPSRPGLLQGLGEGSRIGLVRLLGLQVAQGLAVLFRELSLGRLVQVGGRLDLLELALQQARRDGRPLVSAKMAAL